MEELIGNQLGQYRIEAEIGQGAMAAVFKAYQPNLDRYVAIKVMPPSFAAKNPVFVKRFHREAKSIARLHHPNIVPVYDFGIDRDYSFIVMRYVEGARTLSQVVYRPLGGAPNFDLIIQVAQALAYAHKHGVVHRDIKPSNILLDGGWALLTDFGVAKVSEFATRLTDTGKSIGTPAYMAPEQARGDLVDHRADIYALGIILYEMLTNKLPHDADTPLGILLKRTTEPPPAPRQLNPAIPERLEQVVMRALAARPGDRFDSAEHFALALKAAIAEQPYQISLEGQAGSQGTNVFSTAQIVTDDDGPQPETLTRKLPPKLRPSVWVAGVGLSLAILAGSLWGSNTFSSAASEQSPEQTASMIAVAPTSTDTLTPTQTPVPPTDTPSPTPTSTQTPTYTPEPPTATPVMMVVTATSTPTIEPSPTPNLPTATPTLTPTPTAGRPAGTFALLDPVSLDDPSYGPTDFEWEWSGPVPPDFGFEVRVWREGEPLAGAHDAVLDNQQGRIERLGENRYRLHIDIRHAAGVRERSGEYLWTVALVQISPSYADLGQQATPISLRFEAGGGSSGSSAGNNNGGGSSSSSGGGID